jgi:hypothetical protein
VVQRLWWCHRRFRLVSWVSVHPFLVLFYVVSVAHGQLHFENIKWKIPEVNIDKF